MSLNHYDVLGVPPYASQAAILTAYRDAVRKCHPDLHPDDHQARRKFHRVQTAFEVLSDPEKRKVYNRSRVSFDPTRTGGSRPSGSRRTKTSHRGTGGSKNWGSGRPANSYESLTRYAVTQLADPVTGLAMFTALGFSLHLLATFSDPSCFGEGSLPVPAVLSGQFGFFANLLSCVLGVVVILGAIQMRHLQSYRLAVTASIIATVSCISPWFLPGVPFGIWSLAVLRNGQVQDAFWS